MFLVKKTLYIKWWSNNHASVLVSVTIFAVGNALLPRKWQMSSFSLALFCVGTSKHIPVVFDFVCFILHFMGKCGRTRYDNYCTEKLPSVGPFMEHLLIHSIEIRPAQWSPGNSCRKYWKVSRGWWKITTFACSTFTPGSDKSPSKFTIMFSFWLCVTVDNYLNTLQRGENTYFFVNVYCLEMLSSRVRLVVDTMVDTVRNGPTHRLIFQGRWPKFCPSYRLFLEKSPTCCSCTVIMWWVHGVRIQWRPFYLAFFINEIKFTNLKLFVEVLFPKQGLARIKAFSSSPNDSVRSKLYTLSAVVWGNRFKS